MKPDYQKVAIHGVPRSGTSWVGEIINSSPNVVYKYQPLFSYAHKGFLSPSSSHAEIQTFYERVRTCCDDFTNQSEKRASGNFPSFKKEEITHVAYKEVRYINLLENLLTRDEEIRVVCVIRNPLATIASWLNAPREFRQDLGWKMEEEWREAPKKNEGRPEEFNGFERWKDATSCFLDLKKKFPNRTYLLSYSALLNHPVIETTNLFGFLECPVHEQTIGFLNASTSNSTLPNPYGVFRAKKTDEQWKTQLPSWLVREISNDLSGTVLEHYLQD